MIKDQSIRDVIVNMNYIDISVKEKKTLYLETICIHNILLRRNRILL